jgi:predicted nucleotidyltransferase
VTGAEGSAISVPRYHEAVDASAVEARLKAFFEEDPRGAVAVYLFGSVARGDARSDSDVDVGVLFAAEPPATLSAPQFALEAALERLLVRPVQVVALNRASADLVHRVLRDGHLVLDRDRAARIRFGPFSQRVLRWHRSVTVPWLPGARGSLGRVAEPRR